MENRVTGKLFRNKHGTFCTVQKFYIVAASVECGLRPSVNTQNIIYETSRIHPSTESTLFTSEGGWGTFGTAQGGPVLDGSVSPGNEITCNKVACIIKAVLPTLPVVPVGVTVNVKLTVAVLKAVCSMSSSLIRN